MTLKFMKPAGCITVKAPAKLNLFLEIGDRMEDGYHEIKSVMQSVTLYDDLTLLKKEKGIVIRCSDKDLESETNLAARAAGLFFEKSGINGGVEIRIRKRIPVSAGLGGGSTDAAAALRALNELYARPFSEGRLEELGKSLGADIPFCIRRGLCLAEGIGEKLTDLGELPDCRFVISKGENTVITGEAYAMIDRRADRIRKAPDQILKAVKEKSLGDICGCLYNGFEINGDHDAEIKRIMTDSNALGTLMTGSGPSVFGVFKNDDDAKSACAALQKKGYTGFICRPEKQNGR